MKHFFQSLRWKLQLWHSLLLGIVVAGLLTFSFSLQKDQALIRVDQQLQAWSPRISDSLRQLRPPRPRPLAEPRDLLESDWLKPLELPGDMAPFFEADSETKAYYSIWDPRGRLLTFSDSAPESVPYPSSERGRPRFHTRDSFREFGHLLPEGTAILVGVPLEPVHQKLQALAIKLTLIGAGVLALSLVGWWWFISRSIRPIAGIRQTAGAISEGQLNERIQIDDSESELGKLSLTLNETFERLESSFKQQVRFTADASHELRTPISVILSKTQLTLTRERTPEEYRQAIEVCKKAAERMGNLVESLLVLARFDSGESKPSTISFDLLALIHEAAENVQLLAQESEIELVLPKNTCHVRGVPMWTQQALTNLLVNAIRYCPETEQIDVTINSLDTLATVTVHDKGPGIPVAELSHIFDRFYRLDKARSRDRGGSGLGLAISRSLMEAQGGSIRAESTIGQGSRFSISLPLDQNGH